MGVGAVCEKLIYAGVTKNLIVSHNISVDQHSIKYPDPAQTVNFIILCHRSRSCYHYWAAGPKFHIWYCRSLHSAFPPPN